MPTRRRIARTALAAALVSPLAPAAAAPSLQRLAALARGLNVAHWFRFPPSWAEADVIGYLRDSDLRAIRTAGFTFLRVPLDPAMVALPDGRWHPSRLRQVETVAARILAAGLAVVFEPHPVSSTIFDADLAARERVFIFWRELAPVLARLPPEKVFPELLSEPIFRGREGEWHAMQQALLAEVRARAPQHTIVVTGAEWSSIGGLLRLPKLADPNLVYTFHFYFPMQFTHQATTYVGPAFAGLRGLPWPAAPAEACLGALPAQADANATALAQWYCRQGYDAARLVTEIGRARAWAEARGVALLAGEFGAGCNPPDRATKVRFMRDVRRAMEANRVGWALWALDNCQGLGADPKTRDFTLPADYLGALGLGPP
jgi:endoglucanase